MRHSWKILGVLVSVSVIHAYADSGGLPSPSASNVGQNTNTTTTATAKNVNIPSPSNSPSNSNTTTNLKPVSYIDNALLLEIAKALKGKRKANNNSGSSVSIPPMSPPMLPFNNNEDNNYMYPNPNPNMNNPNLKVVRDVKSCDNDNKEIKVREYYCKNSQCYVYVNDKWLTIGDDLNEYKIINISNNGEVNLICR